MSNADGSKTVLPTQEQYEYIRELCKEKDAIILAHYYQDSAIQDLAHFTGDSLALAQYAARTDAAIIVLAGAYFMAETAKILNPDKKVLIPDAAASCSLAESCDPLSFRAFTERHPGHVVVSYVNCSAEVKALSDVICTSANAVDVINNIPDSLPIIFAPDKHLGAYLMQRTGRELLLWDGACMVHEAFSVEKLMNLVLTHPDAQIIAHPESDMQVLRLAHFVGSTSAMLAHVQSHPAQTFIVATEGGILHEMRKKAPHKTLIPVPSHEDNSCACSECAFMKLNTVDKLQRCLETESHEVTLDEALIEQALVPLERMLAISQALS